MISEDLKKSREATLATHLRGESIKDVDLVLTTMPNPTYDLVTVGRVLRGKEQVGRFLQNMFDALGPMDHQAVAIHHLEDAAVVEVVTVFPDGILGTEPGQELRVPTIAIFPFDGETMLAERIYADATQLLTLLEGV